MYADDAPRTLSIPISWVLSETVACQPITTKTKLTQSTSQSNTTIITPTAFVGHSSGREVVPYLIPISVKIIMTSTPKLSTLSNVRDRLRRRCPSTRVLSTEAVYLKHCTQTAFLRRCHWIGTRFDRMD